MVKNMCYLLGGHRFKTGGGRVAYWPVVTRLEGWATHGIEAHLDGFWDVSAPAKSQVIGISSLQAVGYTLGRLLFPLLKKQNPHLNWIS